MSLYICLLNLLKCALRIFLLIKGTLFWHGITFFSNRDQRLPTGAIGFWTPDPQIPCLMPWRPLSILLTIFLIKVIFSPKVFLQSPHPFVDRQLQFGTYNLLSLSNTSFILLNPMKNIDTSLTANSDRQNLQTAIINDRCLKYINPPLIPK